MTATTPRSASRRSPRFPGHRGLTRVQIDVFEQWATGGRTWLPAKAIDVLVEKGLLVQVGEDVICKDRFGTVTAPIYEVPIGIHMAWCQWCSENVDPTDTGAA
jgi:hypothetical protein